MARSNIGAGFVDARVLTRYLRTRIGGTVLLSVLLLVSTAVAVISPQFLRRFIDEAEAGALVPALVGAAVAYMLFALLAEALQLAADYQGARLAWSTTNELRTDLTRHCLGLDMSFYERHSGGELIERIDGDVDKLANFCSRMFPLIASNLLLLAGIGVALVVQDWRIGLCYVPLVVGSVVLLRRLVGGAIPAAAAQRAAGATLLGFLEEHFGGLEDVRANGAGGHVRRRFWLHAATLVSAVRRAALLGVRWPAAAQGLASLGLVLALLAGGLLYFTGQVTLGGAYLFVVYAGMLQSPLMTIVVQMRDLDEAFGALRRISDLFAEQGGIADGAEHLPAPSGRTGVALELDAVSFRYVPDDFALRDISIRLAPGERLAVVGRTGAGKSTLARLLFRFADPATGRILLDGHDTRELTIDSLRRQVGLVSQEVQLFHATVRDNVTLFDPDVPDADVVRALREIGLGGWLDLLADGLDTVLGTGAAGLSAGEAQLLAFARVLIADPGLVVLDEASSRLDPASRRTFAAAQERLLTGRTAVIIAHQPDAVRSADQVLVLREGRAAGYGDRTALRDLIEENEPAPVAATSTEGDR